MYAHLKMDKYRRCRWCPAAWVWVLCLPLAGDEEPEATESGYTGLEIVP